MGYGEHECKAPCVGGDGSCTPFPLATELGQTILWETKRHEEDMDVLGNKLRALQGEVSTLSHEKAVVETKLLELDQLVGQLLSVNESLVTRLSGKPPPTAGKAKKTKKPAFKPPFVPRAASVSTVRWYWDSLLAAVPAPDRLVLTPSFFTPICSFDHSRKHTGTGLPTKATMAKAMDEADSLHKMHMMYASAPPCRAFSGRWPRR